MAIYVKRYNGSAWVDTTVKRYNGSSWVDAYTYRWNGSSWVQIYPETIVTVDNKAVTSGTMNNYKSKMSDWKSDSTARQGNGTTWGGSPSNWGYMAISASSFTGSGSITSVTSAYFKGTRGGSGYYNNEQTVQFYRSAITTSGTPTTSNIAGNFKCTFKMPGKDTAFSNQAITMGTNGLNWLNQANSQPRLYIYSNVADDYASFTGTCTVTASYKYQASSVAFVDEASTAMLLTAADDYNSIKNTAYHTMTIYKEEENMTLAEIIKRREDGIVEDIDQDTVDRFNVTRPWTKDYKIEKDDNGNLRVKIQVFALGMDDEVQVSLDKIKWTVMKQVDPKTNFMECILPSDYNKVTDWCYIRVINKKTDELYLTAEVEPMIMIP